MKSLTRSIDEARKAYEQGNVELAKQAHMAKTEEQIKEEEEELKDGKSHDEQHSTAGGYIKSAVYGGLDGMITTYSVVMAVAGASLKPVVVLALGIANLIGDGLSMALGDYLSTRSEQQFQAKERERESWEVDNNPEGEKLEMYEIYRKKKMSREDAKQMCDILAKNKEAWVDIMMVEELGLIPDDENPINNALVTFFSFCIFGIIPITPFIYAQIASDEDSQKLFIVSTILTGLALCTLGILKARFSYAKWWLSALETLMVGAIAAAASYLIGLGFEKYTKDAGVA